MRTRSCTRRITAAVLLVAGSAVSSVCFAHWEGFEAADPATPAAVLRLNSAITGYADPDRAPRTWGERFEEIRETTTVDHAQMDHSGHMDNTGEQ